MKVRANWLFALMLLVICTGCPSVPGDVGSGSDAEDDNGDAVSQLEGSIVVDGSSTVFPITEAVANDFKKQFPKVNVTVAVSGTGGGFKRFTKGETDISNASRPITFEEFDECKDEQGRVCGTARRLRRADSRR